MNKSEKPKLPLTKIWVIPPYTMSFYQFVGVDDIISGDNFVQFLRKRAYSLKYTQMEDYLHTSRLIHNWIELGLINEEVRDSKGAWKRFSIRDLLWIRIIAKLRWFDLPIPVIEKVRQFLFTNTYFEEGEYLFDYCVMLTLAKAPINLIVLPHGEAHLVSHLREEDLNEQGDLSEYIHISLNTIVKEVFNQPDLEVLYGHAINLSDKELEFLSMLRNGNFTNIEVITKDGKIERLKASESIDTNSRVSELLKGGDFQEINIQQTNGKIVSIKRTINKKI